MFIVVKQKWVLLVLALLIVLQLALSAVLVKRLFSEKDAAIIDFTVVIDAGHGGIDGGVTSKNGVKESDLNLDYANCLGEYFSRAGFRVVYTRKNGDGLYGVPTEGFKLRDMKKRKEIIENAGANLVISVHMNKFSSSSRSGPQVFFQEGSDEGQALADSLQRVFNSFTGNSHQAIGGDYFICRESVCPAVIVECGFLSNDREAAMLQTSDYRNEVCSKIFDGVMLYLYRQT